MSQHAGGSGCIGFDRLAVGVHVKAEAVVELVAGYMQIAGPLAIDLRQELIYRRFAVVLVIDTNIVDVEKDVAISTLGASDRSPTLV